jgi:hypothetical protein
MLAIHWSPVKNTKVILRNGIRQTKGATYCFPLTGEPYVDKFWARAFRQWRPRTAYNGFIFRVVQDDLPAAFSEWIQHHETCEKPLTSISQIQAEFESAIVSRIGERKFCFRSDGSYNHHLDAAKLGREFVAQNPQSYLEALDSDPGFLAYIFEDYELVLSRPIAPRRIMRVVTGANESGRVVARRKKEKAFFGARSDRDI